MNNVTSPARDVGLGYEYRAKTPDGDSFEISAACAVEGAIVRLHWYPHNPAQSDRGLSVRVRPADCMTVAAGIATALYGAIGRPPPIILERLEDHADSVAAFHVSHGNGIVYIGRGTVSQPDNWTPEAARQLAALVAVHADAADAGSNAEVAELAQVIRDGNPDPGEWQRAAPLMPAEAIARAIIAAGYKRDE